MQSTDNLFCPSSALQHHLGDGGGEWEGEGEKGGMWDVGLGGKSGGEEQLMDYGNMGIREREIKYSE